MIDCELFLIAMYNLYTAKRGLFYQVFIMAN